MASITKRGSTYRIRVSNGRDSQRRQLLPKAPARSMEPSSRNRQRQQLLTVYLRAGLGHGAGKAYRKEQIEYRLQLGSAREGDNYVFIQ